MDIIEKVQDYVVAKRQADNGAKRVKDMRDGLIASVTDDGAETNDLGGREMLLDRAVTDGVKEFTRVSIQTRVTKFLQADEASEFLEARGLLDECLSTYVDEDKVAYLVVKGVISQQEFDGLVNQKVVKALVVS